MDEKNNIVFGAIIMNSKARFIVKNHLRVAFGLIIIPGNHPLKWDGFFTICK
jgi:hypothetical protein